MSEQFLERFSDLSLSEYSDHGLFIKRAKYINSIKKHSYEASNK